MKRFYAVLFDMDGTLVTLGGGILANQKAAEQLGLPVPSAKDLIKKLFGKRYEEAFPDLFPKYAKDKEMLDKFVRLSERIYADEHLAHPLPYAKEVLDTLKKQGYKIGIITNKKRSTAPFSLKDNNFPYDTLVTTDDVKKRKPDPESVYKACKAMRLEPKHCLVIGDSVYDIETAKNSGSASCGITTGISSAIELKEAGADYVINDLKEILDILDIK